MIKSEDFEYYVSWFVTLLSSYVCYVCFFLFLIDKNLYGPSNLFLRISNPANRDLFFQEPANSVMEHIIDFHHDIFFFLIVIVVFVVYMLLRIVYLFGGISVFKPYIDDTVRSGDSFSLGISNINEAEEFKKTYFSDKVTKEIHLNNENVYKPNYLNFHHNTVLEII
jgi:hypothetical protein